MKPFQAAEMIDNLVSQSWTVNDIKQFLGSCNLLQGECTSYEEDEGTPGSFVNMTHGALPLATTGRIHAVPPESQIRFHADTRECGRLTFGFDGTLSFQGKADEAAKVFMESVIAKTNPYVLGLKRQIVELQVEQPPPTRPLRLMVMGHSQHGKDTACIMLARELGVSWISSSLFSADRVVYPALKNTYKYQSVEDCFNDRHQHMTEWFELIEAYNTPDASRLSRELFAEHHIYCGLRNAEELKAAKMLGLYDLAIWVDGSKRKPAQPDTSCTVTAAMADIVLDNNGTEHDLFEHILQLSSILGRDKYVPRG